MTRPTETSDELRQRRLEEKMRNRRVARVASGVIGISAILASLGKMTQSSGRSSIGELWIILILNIVVVVGLLVTRPSRWSRMRAPLAQEVLDEDARAPVIYLRPFEADRRQGWYEHRIARAMKGLGPVVTVGQPQESLPATEYIPREYLPAEEWQEHVVSLTEGAGLVIVHMGTSSGLAWEVEHMVRQGRPDRLVVCFGPDAVPRLIGRHDTAMDYRQFSERFGRLFPKGLPPEVAGAFLAFDHDWTPRPSDTLHGHGQPLEAHLHHLHRSLLRRRLR